MRLRDDTNIESVYLHSFLIIFNSSKEWLTCIAAAAACVHTTVRTYFANLIIYISRYAAVVLCTKGHGITPEKRYGDFELACDLHTSYIITLCALRNCHRKLRIWFIWLICYGHIVLSKSLLTMGSANIGRSTPWGRSLTLGLVNGVYYSCCSGVYH